MRRSEVLFDQNNRPTPAFAAFLADIRVPGEDLVIINEELQKRFFQTGPDGQPLERWELQEVETHWTQEQSKRRQEQIIRHLAECRFIRKTYPEANRYKYAAWPGALVVRASARLDDLMGAWGDGVHWEQTIVFGGKRPLQVDRESFAQCCLALNIEVDDVQKGHFDAARRSWDRINPQTELDMMRWVWENVDLPDGLAKTPIVFVDAPMKPPLQDGGLPIRPSTEDTVTEWLNSKPEPGSILLSSGAPYGPAQDEVFWRLLEPYGFTVDTFGHEASPLPIKNFMREVAGAVFQIKKTRLPS